MPRLPRIYIKDAIYFVTCRGEHDEKVFEDEKDYNMFLELLRKYQEQYGIKIFAFCLLPDHLHLLVEMQRQAKDNTPQTGKSPEISDFMRDLNNNYTKYFNGRYERKGHLFRERFKSALVEKDKYLLEMTAYLHLNPEKLNLCPDSKLYPYSSYQLYIYQDWSKQEDLKFLKSAIDEALGLLKDQTYTQFVNGLAEEERDFIHKRINRGGILGSESFIQQVKSEVQAYQAQGLGQKYEVAGRKSYRLFFAMGSFLLVVIVSAGGIYLLSLKNNLSQTSSQIKKLQTKFQAASRPEAEKPRISISEELKSEEWEIKLIPVSGGSEDRDILDFRQGKFVSEKLNLLGFAKSNYSEVVENNGRLIWETMQTGPDGVASWQGEMREGRMRGTLSLRQKDKAPQDFSFISTGFKRKDEK